MSQGETKANNELRVWLLGSDTPTSSTSAGRGRWCRRHFMLPWNEDHLWNKVLDIRKEVSLAVEVPRARKMSPRRTSETQVFLKDMLAHLYPS